MPLGLSLSEVLGLTGGKTEVLLNLLDLDLQHVKTDFLAFASACPGRSHRLFAALPSLGWEVPPF